MRLLAFSLPPCFSPGVVDRPLAGPATARLVELASEGTCLDGLRRWTSCGSWAAALRSTIECGTHEERGRLWGALHRGDEQRGAAAKYAVAACAGAAGTAPRLATRPSNSGELARCGAGDNSGAETGPTLGSRPVAVAGRKRACSEASEASTGELSSSTAGCSLQ